MRIKKSFKELAKTIEILHEDQQGMLKGGFSSMKISQELFHPTNGDSCVCEVKEKQAQK